MHAITIEQVLQKLESTPDDQVINVGHLKKLLKEMLQDNIDEQERFEIENRKRRYNDELLDDIEDMTIKLLSYYSYPTGTKGQSWIGSSNSREPNDRIETIVNNALNAAVGRLGFRRSNKEAVKFTLSGRPTNIIYAVAYDDSFILCTEIRPEGKEYKLD